MERQVKPAVKALIEKDGKVLALKAEPGERKYWILPGGRVEYGEAPLEALEREIEEELSASIEIGEAVGMYHFFTGPEDDGDQVFLTVYEGSINGQEVDISQNPAEEYITGYEWLEPEEFIEKSSNRSLQELLKNYYSL